MNTIVIILLAVLGAILGSFINVLIYRLPRKESIIYPASHCGNCGKHIPAYLNIPIISYIILGGKCKYCHAKIHWHHLLVEIITPLILIGLFLQYGLLNILFFKYAILCLVMIPIFFIDAFHQIIPHKLSIPLIPLGLIFALIPGNDVGVINSLIAAIIIFCFLVFLAYAYRLARKVDGLGGGDIWLLTGIAAFFGLLSMPYVVLFAALLGIIYFLIFVKNKKQGFAFGTFIAISTILWSLFGAETALSYVNLI
nr:leader peptidase (prepilin peptidase) / N-methyltransferase [Candidatus Cloacimonadota bacterium]